MSTMNQSSEWCRAQNKMDAHVKTLAGMPAVGSGVGKHVPQAVSPQVAEVVRALTKSTSSLDEILKDCGLVEKPVYQMLAQPVGFSGSPVSFEVTRKYAVGTRITRADGRLYKICRVRRTRKTRTEALNPSRSWRVL